MVAMQNLCTRGCLLHNGTIVYQGDINSAISKYAELHQPANLQDLGRTKDLPITATADGSIQLKSFEILDDSGKPIDSPKCGDDITIKLGIHMTYSLKNTTVLISVNDQFGSRITQVNSEFAGTLFNIEEGENTLSCAIPNLPLSPKEYTLDMKILNKRECLLMAEGFGKIVIQSGDFFGTGKMPDSQWSGVVHLKHRWSCRRDCNELENN
jgi:hypothetical protein